MNKNFNYFIFSDIFWYYNRIFYEESYSSISKLKLYDKYFSENILFVKVDNFNCCLDKSIKNNLLHNLDYEKYLDYLYKQSIYPSFVFNIELVFKKNIIF